MVDRKRTADAKFDVVTIAASTGGPAALEAVLSSLGGDFPVPILIVQHMMPAFVGEFASWLDQIAPIEVRVAADGERLRAGRAYVAPEDLHLEVDGGGRVSLSDAPACGYHRPSANRLFETAARIYGERAVGIVLTGMGNDGLDGIQRLYDAGGMVIAQDEESCVVYGMPHAVINAGIVDEVLPLGTIAPRLTALLGRNRESETEHAETS